MHFSSMLQNFHSIFSSCCLFIFIGAVDNSLSLCVFHDCVSVSPLMGRNVLATVREQKIRTVVQSDGHQPCMSTASFSPKLCSNGASQRRAVAYLPPPTCPAFRGDVYDTLVVVFANFKIIKFLDSFKINQVPF